MFLDRNWIKSTLPVYDVEELSMEEALLVLAAEKESLRNDVMRYAQISSPGSELQHRDLVA
ncbi:MAG: hypothetical protein GY934_20125 [Gammaproteobacteria bacterium]|nr:hypothetical protein [Gammaproteobacteria bacterium]